MAEIDIKQVRSKDAFELLSPRDKNLFLHYNVYRFIDASVPDYHRLEDMWALEAFLWANRQTLARDYVMTLSSNISSKVYKMFPEGADSNEIALTFYYRLLRADPESRVAALAEVLLQKMEEEDAG